MEWYTIKITHPDGDTERHVVADIDGSGKRPLAEFEELKKEFPNSRVVIVKNSKDNQND